MLLAAMATIHKRKWAKCMTQGRWLVGISCDLAMVSPFLWRKAPQIRTTLVVPCNAKTQRLFQAFCCHEQRGVHRTRFSHLNLVRTAWIHPSLVQLCEFIQAQCNYVSGADKNRQHKPVLLGPDVFLLELATGAFFYVSILCNSPNRPPQVS